MVQVSYSVSVTDTFPRQHARTQRFTLGEPRNVTVSPDGKRVVFLRSADGSDQVNALWVFDVDSGTERLVADPPALLSTAEDEPSGELPPEERALRERAREAAGGITSYATDRDVTVVAFALAGRLFAGGLVSGQARELPVDGPVFDPRPDPTARRVAYVSGRSLRIGELDGSSRTLVGAEEAEPDTVSWGSADFIAAEEMGRFRGYWWSPDGATLAVCRVDDAPVTSWAIADPAHPDQPARSIRYPAAGTANPAVTLHLIGLDGSRTEVDWDRDFFPYLAAVDWSAAGLDVARAGARPAGHHGARRRHERRCDAGRDLRAVARLRRRLGRTGSWHAGPPRRRAARDGRRPRWHPQTAGRGRPGDAARAPGAVDRVDER